MEKIKNDVIEHFKLSNSISHNLEYFNLSKKVYITFYDEIINKSNIETILNTVEQDCKNNDFNNWKSIIIVAKTTEDNFNKKDLSYFDGNNTFANFFLVNEEMHKNFSNDSFIFVVGGLNVRGYVKQINKIISV